MAFSLEDTNDLAQISGLTEDVLNNSLKERYSRNQIYVSLSKFQFHSFVERGMYIINTHITHIYVFRLFYYIILYMCVRAEGWIGRGVYWFKYMGIHKRGGKK